MKNFWKLTVKGATEFFRNRKTIFFVDTAVAVCMLAAAIVSGVVFAGTDYSSIWVVLLAVFGILIFAVCALYRANRLGAIALAILSFLAFLIFVRTTYSTLETAFVQSDELSEGVPTIVLAVIFVVCCIAENVCAWFHMDKEQETDSRKNEKISVEEKV